MKLVLFSIIFKSNFNENSEFDSTFHWHIDVNWYENGRTMLNEPSVQFRWKDTDIRTHLRVYSYSIFDFTSECLLFFSH